MERMWLVGWIVVVLAGCAGPDNSKEKSEWKLQENNEAGDVGQQDTGGHDMGRPDSGPDVGPDSGPADTGTDAGGPDMKPSCLGSVPEAHRPNSHECDTTRRPGAVVDPNDPNATCKEDADCTEGANGRCIGNSHDSYYCTYDACFEDTECGAGSVCECDGGWRGDHNVCLPGNCTTDADCATGFCSPSMGDCGAYGGTIGYFCHTCEDECINDSDCGNTGDPWGPYCMYEPGVGKWLCSDSQCAG